MIYICIIHILEVYYKSTISHPYIRKQSLKMAHYILVIDSKDFLISAYIRKWSRLFNINNKKEGIPCFYMKVIVYKGNHIPFSSGFRQLQIIQNHDDVICSVKTVFPDDFLLT